MDRPGGVEDDGTGDDGDVNKNKATSRNVPAAPEALLIGPTQQPKSGAPTPDGAEATAAKIAAAEAGEERNVVASEPATRAASEEDDVGGVGIQLPRALSLPAVVANEPSDPAARPADASTIAPQEDRTDRSDAPGEDPKSMEVDAAAKAAPNGDSGAAAAADAATPTAVAAVVDPAQQQRPDETAVKAEEPGPPPFPARSSSRASLS